MQKLLQQLKSGFTRTINWNKYHSKVAIERQNQYEDGLIDPSFRGVNRLVVLSFEDNNDRIGDTRYFLLKVKIKVYNVMIDDQNVLDQPVETDLRTYNNIQKTGQGDDYATSCLLDHLYFK